MATTTTDAGLLTCPPRWATRRNPDRPTLGPAVGKVAADLGMPLMPHQQYVLDVGLELDPTTGIPWYRDVGVSIHRQSGKSGMVLPTAVHRGLTFELLGWGRRALIKLVLQNAAMARRKLLLDYWPVIDHAPRVRRQMTTPIRSAAAPAIVFGNGARWEVGGNTRDANHSQTIHAAFLDECFAYGPDGDEEGGIRPAMATVAAAQQWCLSAAGDADSLWWNEYQDSARDIVESGLDSRRAYFEWGAPDDADLDDETGWPAYMPGLAYGLVPLGVIRADHERMGAGEFARAYGNRRTGAAEVLFPPRRWAACAADLAPLDSIQFAVDVGYGAEGKPRQSAIAAAGWNGDRPVVELVATGDGTSWVIPRLRELMVHRPVSVTLDERGPVVQLHQEIRKVVPASRLRFLNTQQVCAAAELFHQRVLDGAVAHRGQAELDVAVAGVKRRPVGDAWAFGRKASSSNVAPLVAVSFAHQALVTRGRVIESIL